ncbi:glycosyltransferase family 4 protein [Pseudonocardia sp.]|uniref:glycosyltransferase family 4 protein n=1 Tax=Pseudonocardia sp. TaxID=60912 RepID=UPI0031FC3A51
MRIVQVVNVGFEAGGAEKSVRLITDGMRRRGHEVHVVATDHLLGAQDSFADTLVPSIKGGPLTRLAGYFWHRAAYRRVREVMSAFRPEVVHLHTIGEFSPAVLAATASTGQLLTVHGPEDWTLELLRWNLPSAGKPRLSPGDKARYLYLRLLQRPAYLPWLRKLDRVLTPSRFVAGAVRADVGAVPVHVLPNGVPLPASSPVPDSSEVLFVGRLEPVKGVRMLVDAFGQVARRRPDARLTLVGDGNQRLELQQLVAELGLQDRVAFRGWLSPATVKDAYESAAVVVIPSLWPENFPTVALEALGIGRAIVGARVGGIPEVVTDGENGVLVPQGDVGALAVALDDLLADRDRLRSMGAASARRGQHYGVEQFLDELERHYEEVGHRAHRRR